MKFNLIENSMYEGLFDYIAIYGKVELSDPEKEAVRKLWQPKKLRKRQYFLEEGKVCDYTGFLISGAMRQYSIDEDGSEHVIQLAVENWWIADRNSFLNRTPSRYFIEAWEDCQLLVLHHTNLNGFLEIPAVKRMFWEMDQKNHIAAQKRLEEAISLPALKRYEHFQLHHPEFLQRFPQHQIASYLGISKETLSRLRKPSGKSQS